MPCWKAGKTAARATLDTRRRRVRPTAMGLMPPFGFRRGVMGAGSRAASVAMEGPASGVDAFCCNGLQLPCKKNDSARKNGISLPSQAWKYEWQRGAGTAACFSVLPSGWRSQ